MIIKIKGFNIDEVKEMKATHVEAWYDKHTRLWVVQNLTDEGYQVGDAKYVYGKKGAMEVKAEMEKKLEI